MKRTITLLITLMAGLFTFNHVSAQCTPDPLCLDTLEPGEYCPQAFPPLILDMPYDEIITFVMDMEIVHNGTTYNLDSIAVDSVRNIPPGLTYSSSATGYVPDSAYCSRLTGTPTLAGEFPIVFYLQPFVDFGSGLVSLGQFVDDTSVVITVYNPTGVNPGQADQFQIRPVVPNPFSDMVQISFYTPLEDQVVLQVYSILGKKIYEETRDASPGEHQFEFKGDELLPGTYFYRITNNKALYTGKFIKSK